MGFRLIRNRDLVRTPWKNGGGTTAEVAVEPAGADFDHFDWRISMADVAADGPFSIFAGIDRTLALIEGVSLEIDVEGIVHRLDAAAPSLRFAGDARTSARLPAGPVRDFNVMTRRARVSHRLGLFRPEEGAVTPGGSVLIVAALEDASVVVLDGLTFDLDRHDVLIADPAPSTLITRRTLIRVDIDKA